MGLCPSRTTCQGSLGLRSDRYQHYKEECQLSVGGGKMVHHYVHGICKSFIRERVESRGRLEDEGTTRTTTSSLDNPVDEEQWRIAQGRK